MISSNDIHGGHFDGFQDFFFSRLALAFWCQIAAMTAVFWAVQKTPLEKVAGWISGVVGLALLFSGEITALGGIALLVLASRLISGKWGSDDPD
jgi:hypothetical protein